MTTTLFLRDDDIGAPTDALIAFHEAFAERHLPVSYQVIPAQLTDDCAAWLREVKATTPDLIEVGQHGHTHEMVVAGKTEYYEFGPERNLETQLSVIEAGRAVLEAKLGDVFNARLFTPPRHRFNRDTLTALGRAGFGILSSSSYPKPLHQLAYRAGRTLGLTNIGRGGVSWHGQMRPEAPLLEMSISVAVDDGSPRERQVDDVLAAIAAARKLTPWVGLMFHHQAWPPGAGGDFINRLGDALAALPNVQFATLGQIADTLQTGER
jgi:predicted deacetylase